MCSLAKVSVNSPLYMFMETFNTYMVIRIITCQPMEVLINRLLTMYFKHCCQPVTGMENDD